MLMRSDTGRTRSFSVAEVRDMCETVSNFERSSYTISGRGERGNNGSAGCVVRLKMMHTSFRLRHCSRKGGRISKEQRH